MVNKQQIVLLVVTIAFVLMLSGCTQQKPAKSLTPEEVVTNYWSDIGKGDYNSAYDLSYHANQNTTRQVWLDQHMSKWGQNGSYIKIYNFNVTGNTPIDSSVFGGNFTEARLVSTKATISYMGQNETGQLRMILVNTTDGWKIYGNY